jgi:hypothetical protein
MLKKHNFSLSGINKPIKITSTYQGFPEATFLKPAPLPSEISHTSNAL